MNKMHAESPLKRKSLRSSFPIGLKVEADQLERTMGISWVKIVDRLGRSVPPGVHWLCRHYMRAPRPPGSSPACEVTQPSGQSLATSSSKPSPLAGTHTGTELEPGYQSPQGPAPGHGHGHGQRGPERRTSNGRKWKGSTPQPTNSKGVRVWGSVNLNWGVYFNSVNLIRKAPYKMKNGCSLYLFNP